MNLRASRQSAPPPGASRSPITGESQLTWIIAGGVVVAALTPLVIWQPATLIAAGAAIFLVGYFKWPWLRLISFVFGALLVFQTSDGLSPQKLAYVGLVLLGVVISITRTQRPLRTMWGSGYKLAITGAGGLALWILLITLPHSLIQGTSFEFWARDALTYLMISAAVFIGLDAAGSTPLPVVRGIAVGVGVLSAIGFATAWIAARGILAGDDAEGRSLFASMTAITIPMALALTLALVPKRPRLLWLLLGVGLIISVLITGTRTGVVLLVVFIGIAGSHHKMRVPAWKVLIGAASSALLIILLLPIAGALFSSATYVQERLESIRLVFEGGFQQDRSGSVRQLAYAYAEQIWHANQFMGHGVGTPFPNPNPGATVRNFSLDTPMMFLAKFGLVGTIVLVITLSMIVWASVRKEAGIPWVPEQTAVRGSAVVWISMLPLSAVPEDKGFALSIAIAVALTAAAKAAASKGIDGGVSGILSRPPMRSTPEPPISALR